MCSTGGMPLSQEMQAQLIGICKMKMMEIWPTLRVQLLQFLKTLHSDFNERMASLVEPQLDTVIRMAHLQVSSVIIFINYVFNMTIEIKI